MPCTGGRFKPLPNEPIVLGNQKYVVQPHPAAPAAPFSAEGRRAVVFNLTGPSNDICALKVFKKTFRNPSLLESATLVDRFQHLPGMLAAKRIVIGPTDRAAVDCPDLLYSALMPWIGGSTWNDVLMRAENGGAVYGLDVGLRLCARFLEVMSALEREGAAHTDIAPGNVIVNPQTFDVQLLDLEDIFVPGSNPPQAQNTGSAGYRHPTADQGKTTWCAEGDRYATAVLAAEILLLVNPAQASQTNDNGFFGGDRTTPSGTQRFNSTYPFLQYIAPQFAILFETAWMSPTLEACPRASELLAAILLVPVPQPKPQTHIPGVAWQSFSAQQPTPAATTASAAASQFWSQTAAAKPTPASSSGTSTGSQPAQSTQGSRLSPAQWALLVIAILVVAGLVITGAIVASNHSEQERQRAESARIQAQQVENSRRQEESDRTQALRDEQRRQQAEAEKQKQAQNEAAEIEAAQRLSRYEAWLRTRGNEMAPKVITVRVLNACPDHTIDFAIRFKVPNNTGHWVTLGGFEVKPGESVNPAMATDDSNIYLYGESGPLTWTGKNDPNAKPTKIVDNSFVHEDGDDLDGKNPKIVSMFRRVFNTYGEHTLRLSCPTRK
jgi:serine/threonine protein kinase